MSALVSDIFPKVNAAVGFPVDTPLIAYVETTKYPKAIDSESTFFDESISTGSILIFQQSLGDELLEPMIEFFEASKPSDECEEETIERGEFASVPVVSTIDAVDAKSLSVTQFLGSRAEPLEILVSDFRAPSEPLFFLRFPSSTTFSDVKKHIAQHARIDYSPDHDSIELYKEDTDNPHTPSLYALALSYTSPSFLLSRRTLYSRPFHHVFFDFIAGISEKDIGSTRNIPICLSTDGYTIARMFHFRVSKNVNIGEIKNSLLAAGELDEGVEYRFIEEWKNKIYRVFAESDVLYQSNSPLRIDIVPEDQREVGCDDVLAKCGFAHPGDFYLDCFGSPFMLKVKCGETLKQLRERVKMNLKMDDEEFGKFVFMVGNTYGTMSDLVALESDDEVVAERFVKDQCLFLVSKEQKPKKKNITYGYGGYRTKEKALKIGN